MKSTARPAVLAVRVVAAEAGQRREGVADRPEHPDRRRGQPGLGRGAVRTGGEGDRAGGPTGGGRIGLRGDGLLLREVAVVDPADLAVEQDLGEARLTTPVTPTWPPASRTSSGLPFSRGASHRFRSLVMYSRSVTVRLSCRVTRLAERENALTRSAEVGERASVAAPAPVLAAALLAGRGGPVEGPRSAARPRRPRRLRRAGRPPGSPSRRRGRRPCR